jgi:hypothetical protein
MRHVRWGLLLLASVVTIGASASAVLAGAHTYKAATATYWNNVLEPTVTPPAAPVHYLDTARWQFTGLPSDLYGAVEVDLNFHAIVQSIQDGGGSGYGATLSVTVTGVSTATYSVTLANPWRPHVAYSNAPGYGQDAFASLKLPTSLWKNASTLTVTAKAMTTNSVISFGDSGLLIGYVTSG